MNESFVRRAFAASLAVSLAAFGPGLSGYEAAAQMRVLPVSAEGLPAPVSLPSATGEVSDAPALPAAPLSEPGPLEKAGPLSTSLEPSRLAESLASSLTRTSEAPSASIARARAGQAAWRGQSARIGEALGSARGLGSMSDGSVHGLGATIEELLTRTRSIPGSGDVEVEASEGLGSLGRAPAPRFAPSASRGLSAAPEDAAPAGRDDAAAFTRRVYDWMAAGLGVTAAFAYAVGTNAAMTAALFSSPALLIGLVVAELGLVIGLGVMLPKLSFQAAAGGFLTYAALNGVLLSSVLQVYAAASVVAAFAVTAGMFAGVAAFGHLTKRNLDGVGMYAGMALWGLILASVANMFLHSSGLNALLNYAGVLVFTGLTAFDAQKIRQMAKSGIGSRGPDKNLAIWGALTLYLDFVNLFLYVLKIIGKAKEEKK